MNVRTFEIEGLKLIEPKIFNDERGLFYESFNANKYKEILGDVDFFQDNISTSKKNVLRGLHFQSPPYAQGKLVTVLKGSVIDVAVDIRQGSSTYGKHIVAELNEINKHQLWIPPGFAHGFLSLEEGTIFSYKCSNYYSPQHENTLLWNDPNLNINWRIKDVIISTKDKEGQEFINFVSPF